MLEVRCKTIHLPASDISPVYVSTDEMRAVVYAADLRTTRKKTILRARVATAATTYHARIAEVLNGNKALHYSLPQELAYSRAISLGLQTAKATEIFSLAHSADDESPVGSEYTDELLRMLGAGVWGALQKEVAYRDLHAFTVQDPHTADVRRKDAVVIRPDSSTYATYQSLVANGQIRLHEDFVDYTVNY
ncbi:MAG: hypothetical protein WBP12_02165 [Candidatus Saccharimonas sp.]